VSSRGDGERVKRRVILLYSRLIVAESAFHRGRERERERERGGGWGKEGTRDWPRAIGYTSAR